VSMSSHELERRLRMGVVARHELRQLRSILVDFAADGGDRDDATRVIEALRHELGEVEALLDLLDLVCGFCEPRLRIWSDDSYRRGHSAAKKSRL
jgi:hypothetical protein